MDEENTQLTEEQYQKLRAETVKSQRSMIESQGGTFDEATFKLTCDDCPAKLRCEFSADDYNTNGDCLAEK